MQATRQYFISVCLIAVILINFMGVISNASLLHEKNQALAKDDIVLICSGRSFQYISLSIFESSGQIVVVEPPNSDNAYAEFDCPTDESLDNKQSLAFSYAQALSFLIVRASEALPFQASEYVENHYNPSLARAPPLFV